MNIHFFNEAFAIRSFVWVGFHMLYDFMVTSGQDQQHEVLELIRHKKEKENVKLDSLITHTSCASAVHLTKTSNLAT